MISSRQKKYWLCEDFYRRLVSDRQMRIAASSPRNDLSLGNRPFLRLPHDEKVVGLSEHQQGIATMTVYIRSRII